LAAEPKPGRDNFSVKLGPEVGKSSVVALLLQEESAMRSILVTGTLALVLASAAQGDTAAIVDLSQAATISTHVAPGVVSVKVINMLPGKQDQYAVTANVEGAVEQPVSIANAKAKVIAPKITTCTVLETAKTAVKTATTEKEIAAATASIRTEAAQTACPEILLFLPVVDLDLGAYSLTSGDVLTITVVRKDTSTTWTRRFTAGQRGQWLAAYGLLFAPNHDANYSSYALGNNTFQIRRSRDRERFV
jgi:hypothetical protein